MGACPRYARFGPCKRSKCGFPGYARRHPCRQIKKENESPRKTPHMPEPRVLSVEIAKLAEERGRRGYEQRAYTEKLMALMPSALAQGPMAQLDIYTLLILSKFDFNTNSKGAMRR